MEFNSSKTDSLVFSRKIIVNAPILKMRNTNTKEVKEHKHLGIQHQKNGKWSTHITETITKAKKKVDILRGLK